MEENNNPVGLFSKKDLEEMRANLLNSKVLHDLVKGKIKLIAHRGMGPTSLMGPTFAHKYKPENTISAFKEAMILGADGIELDIFLSSDRKIMVIHDNELWRNVYNIKRDGSDLPSNETKESFDVGRKTGKQLKELSVGPSGEKIPTLEEVFQLTALCNSIRTEYQMKPIILNIEIKDKTVTNECLESVLSFSQSNPKSGVDFENICFCSFNHDALLDLKSAAKKADIVIAAAIKTTLLFGEHNVNKKEGFKVKAGAQYDVEGLKKLKELVVDNGFAAYDAVLWDIFQPLITLASQTDKELHASTSDFRQYEEHMKNSERSFILFLLQASKEVKLLMFKCDNIKQIKLLFIDECKRRKSIIDRRWYAQFNQERQLLRQQESSSGKILATILPRPRQNRVHSKPVQFPISSEQSDLTSELSEKSHDNMQIYGPKDTEIVESADEGNTSNNTTASNRHSFYNATHSSSEIGSQPTTPPRSASLNDEPAANNAANQPDSCCCCLIL